MSLTCPDHCDEEAPWMCQCTRRTLEASRRMVETRDLVIADLHREIRELRAALNGTPSEWDGTRTEAGV